MARARRWDVATPGSASSALPTTTAEADLRYTYDATDDRTIKAAYDASGDVVYTVYPLDPLELRGAAWDADAGDYERTTATQAAYLFAHGVRLGRIATAANGDDPSLTDAAWHLFLELPDHLGSTSTVIDAETGELVEEGTYQAYGSAESDYRPERWDSFREDYRFTGKEEDIQVGLQYFGKRYYAPALGRWLSADPLAIHDLGSDLNVYAYVHGSVFRSVDPTGLQNVQPDNSPSYAGPPTLEEVKQAEANRQAESQKHRAELEAQGPMGKMDLWFEKHPSVYKVAENLYLLVQVVSVSHDLNQLLEGGSSLFQSGVAGRATSTPASEAFEAPATALETAEAPEAALETAEAREAAATSETTVAPPARAQAAPPATSEVQAGKPSAKRGPKTDPNEPHNATIRREGERLEAEGNTIVAGGGRLKERLVPTPGGLKNGRRPDILYRTPGPASELRGTNIGKVNARDMPIPREQEALDDLSGPGGLPMTFVRYN